MRLQVPRGKGCYEVNANDKTIRNIHLGPANIPQQRPPPTQASKKKTHGHL